MARMARVVIPGVPHHVVQRGNRRMDVFFGDDDYRTYLRLVSTFARKSDTAIWAYCLMPNHVHLILVPSHADGLRGTLAEAHRIYAREINRREEWQGHLWQERFYSYPMSDDHLLHAARYIELNPVTAKMVRSPTEWPWSSARAHLVGSDDGIVTTRPLLERVGDWQAILAERMDPDAREMLEKHLQTGRPVGDTDFVERLEALTGRRLRPAKRGRKSSRV